MVVGSSAGGLAALKELLSVLPEGEGFLYVLVQYLDPSHPSMFVDTLQKSTSLKMKSIVEGEKFKPDIIYVVPQDENCQMVNDAWLLSDIESEVGPSTPSIFCLPRSRTVVCRIA